MGERVRVLDLAQDMIELSGLRLGQDIDISYTGLRPGEKMIETLFSEDEHPGPTEQEKILVIRNAEFIPQPKGDMNIALQNLRDAVADIERLHQDVEHLIALAREGNSEATREKLLSIVRESG